MAAEPKVAFVDVLEDLGSSSSGFRFLEMLSAMLKPQNSPKDHASDSVELQDSDCNVLAFQVARLCCVVIWGCRNPMGHQ